MRIGKSSEFIGSIVIVLLAIIPLVVLWFSAPAIPQVNLPVFNGYPILVKSGTNVVNQNLPADIAAADADALRIYIADNAEILIQIRSALRMECMVPVEYTRQYQQRVGQDPSVRNVGRLLLAEARLAELEGNRLDTAEKYGAVVDFSQQASNNGLLLQLALVYEHEAWRALADLAGQLNEEERAVLLDRLESIDYKSPNLNEFWAREEALNEAVNGRWNNLVSKPARNSMRKPVEQLMRQRIDDAQVERIRVMEGLQEANRPAGK